MPAGSLCGALLVSYVADQIGRKKTVILSGIIWVVGSILQCSAIVCTLPSIYREICSTLNCHTGPRYANHRPNYLRCIRWYRIYHYSALSVRNCRALNPRSPRLSSTMVYYVGYSHPIFHPIRLLLHQRRCVFPDTMGSPSNSGRYTFHRHDRLPRIPSVAHRPPQVLILIRGSLCLSNPSSPPERKKRSEYWQTYTEVEILWTSWCSWSLRRSHIKCTLNGPRVPNRISTCSNLASCIVSLLVLPFRCGPNSQGLTL